jgi:hypothetical protein
MNNTHLKWLGIAGIVLACSVTAAALVIVRPAPIPPISRNAPESAANPSHPSLTWSPTSVAINLAPGETASRDVSFLTSMPLSNFTVEAVPEIAPFLTISPNTATTVPAGQSQNLHIAVTIPSGTPLNVFTGTIHVRTGNATIPQTLKVTITTGLSFSTPSYSIQYPADWTVATTSGETGFVPSAKAVNLDTEYVGDIVIETFPKSAGTDLQSFYAQDAVVNLFENSQTQTNLTINGLPAFRFTSVASMIPTDIVAVDKGSVVVEISDVGQLHAADGIFDLMVQSIH